MDFYKLYMYKINHRMVLLLWLNFVINISSYFEIVWQYFALKFNDLWNMNY